MTRALKRHQYSVYLLKEEVSDPGEALSEKANFTELPLNIYDGDAKLFLRSSHGNTPTWLKALAAFTDKTLEGISQSVSGIVACPIQGRWFLVSYGYGWSSINPTQVEKTFGLIVALNTVPPDSLRTIDSRTFEGATISQKSQSSKDMAVSGFGLDVQRNLVSAVGGRPSNPAFWGNLVGGREAFKFSASEPIDQLSLHFEQMLQEFQNPEYKQNYAWIENIRPERDSTVVKQLRVGLSTSLIERTLDRIWLAPPAVFDLSRFGGVKFLGTRCSQLFDEYSWDGFFEAYKEESDLSWDALQARHIEIKDIANGETLFRAPASRWINAELDLNGSTYVLADGDWYYIDKRFLGRVNSDCDSIRIQNEVLPDCEGLCETCYNERVPILEEGIFCFDQETIAPANGESTVEICDLLTSNDQLIHVKRYSGSSTLSHLFNQGVNSTQLLKADATIRSEFADLVNTKMPESSLCQGDISGISVLFAIIHKDEQAQLPVFSRISLHNALRSFSLMGINVAWTIVPHKGAKSCTNPSCKYKKNKSDN